MTTAATSEREVPGTPYRLLSAPGRTLKKVYFIQDEPVYLPRLLDKVLRETAESTVMVVSMETVQGKRTFTQTVMALAKLYGFGYFVQKATEVAIRKLTDRLAPKSARFGIRTSSVRRVCAHYGVECRNVRDVNDPAFLEELRRKGVECIMSISGTQLYKKALREQTPYGILNCHGALLPVYRGLMPSFWMLANGEREAGVSVHFVDEKLDNGPILVQERYRLLERDCLEDVMRRSKDLAAECVIRAVRLLEGGDAPLMENDASRATSFTLPTHADTIRLLARGHRLR